MRSKPPRESRSQGRLRDLDSLGDVFENSRGEPVGRASHVFERKNDFSQQLIITMYCEQGLTVLPSLRHDLIELRCYGNCLTTLVNDEQSKEEKHLPNTLKKLYCTKNMLISLPKLPENLKDLECGNNRLITLESKAGDKLPNSLTRIHCPHNRLTKLPEHLPTSLKYLYCWNNYLTTLPKQLPELVDFWYYNNLFLYNFRKFIHLKNKLDYQHFLGYHNSFCFDNYKILVILQRKIQSKIQSKNKHYFCRDINRLCNNY